MHIYTRARRYHAPSVDPSMPTSMRVAYGEWGRLNQQIHRAGKVRRAGRWAALLGFLRDRWMPVSFRWDHWIPLSVVQAIESMARISPGTSRRPGARVGRAVAAIACRGLLTFVGSVPVIGPIIQDALSMLCGELGSALGGLFDRPAPGAR